MANLALHRPPTRSPQPFQSYTSSWRVGAGERQTR